MNNNDTTGFAISYPALSEGSPATTGGFYRSIREASEAREASLAGNYGTTYCRLMPATRDQFIAAHPIVAV